MSDRDSLLADIEAFLRETGMAPTTFGRRACNNHKVVQRLRLGRSVQLDTASKLRRYMEMWRITHRPLVSSVA